MESGGKFIIRCRGVPFPSRSSTCGSLRSFSLPVAWAKLYAEM
jgi:hypothetical protein